MKSFKAYSRNIQYEFREYKMFVSNKEKKMILNERSI